MRKVPNSVQNEEQFLGHIGDWAPPSRSPTIVVLQDGYWYEWV